MSHLESPSEGCLDENQVVAYLERRQSVQVAARIEAHVDRCHTCRGLLSQLARAALVGSESELSASSDAISSDGLRVVGDYQLEERVARGGMGEIWRAVDPRGRVVAIKRIYLGIEGEVTPSDQQRVRLLREAEALERLHNEHIVRCFGAGLDADGQPYLVLEWLEGEDLANRQARAPLSLDQALDVVCQALRGLVRCHQQDLVHRDIKPANIYLVGPASEPRVKLVDFGLALMQSEASRLTGTGTLLGTLHYLSAEQARGARGIDHRTDIYSMGVVLYQLTTGRLPFSARHPAALLLKIVTETPSRPRQVRPELPVEVERLIVGAMHRDPAHRYQSAAQMLEAVERVFAVGTMQTIGAPIASIDSSPTTQIDRLLMGQSERRLVSLLYVKADGTAQQQPIERAIEGLGGRLHRLLDGQVVGLFGLEQSAGDEALRAVQAGLELRATPEAGLLGMLAATVHLEHGDGVKLGAEELDQALGMIAGLPAGELIVDATTRGLLGDRLQVEDMHGYLAVRQLVAHSLQRHSIFGRRTPTIGREVELAALRAAQLRVAEYDEPAAQLVVGPAGMGKSRLVHDLRDELRQGSVLYLEGRPDSSHLSRPYALLSDVFHRAARVDRNGDDRSRQRALRRWIASHVPEGAEELSLFMGEAIGIPYSPSPALAVARRDPKLLRERIAESFEALFHAAGKSGVVVLCLEDLHWADDESLRLCERLLQRLDATPLFLLGTTRPELLLQRPDFWSGVEARRLTLEPLGPRSLERLIRAVLGDVHPDVVSSIARHCEGNPFFVEELSAWMAAGDRLPGPLGIEPSLAEAGSAADLPPTVEATIQSRLDQLDPEQKELLKSLSVVGDVFSERVCAGLGFSDARERLERLQFAGFFAPRPDDEGLDPSGGFWAFRHALVRQVAYEMIPEPQRRELHLGVGHWLEAAGDRDAALLAHHYQRGHDLERAAHFFARAGQRALRDSDPTSAMELYQSALGASCTVEQEFECRGGLAKAQYLLGRYSEAEEVIEGLSQDQWQQASADGQAELWLLRGRILCATTKYGAAGAALDRAAHLLGRRAVPRGLAVVQAPLSGQRQQLLFDVDHTQFVVSWCEGHYELAGRLVEDLRQTAAAPDQRCAADLALAYYDVVAGDLSRAQELAEGAAELARQIGHAYRELDALLLLVSARELLGDYGRGKSALDRALQCAAHRRSLYHLAHAKTLQGRICLLQGDSDGALVHYRAACVDAEAIGDQRSLAQAQVGAARALCRRGGTDNLERAEQLASSALELVRERVAPLQAEVHLALAEIQLAKGCDGVEQALLALSLLDDLGTQEQTEVEILLVGYDALLASGSNQQATKLLERGHRQLEQRRSRISDQAAAESFARKVPHNARLYALWRESLS